MAERTLDPHPARAATDQPLLCSNVQLSEVPPHKTTRSREGGTATKSGSAMATTTDISRAAAGPPHDARWAAGRASSRAIARPAGQRTVSVVRGHTSRIALPIQRMRMSFPGYLGIAGPLVNPLPSSGPFLVSSPLRCAGSRECHSMLAVAAVVAAPRLAFPLATHVRRPKATSRGRAPLGLESRLP